MIIGSNDWRWGPPTAAERGIEARAATVRVLSLAVSADGGSGHLQPSNERLFKVGPPSWLFGMWVRELPPVGSPRAPARRGCASRNPHAMKRRSRRERCAKCRRRRREQLLTNRSKMNNAGPGTQGALLSAVLAGAAPQPTSVECTGCLWALQLAERTSDLNCALRSPIFAPSLPCASCPLSPAAAVTSPVADTRAPQDQGRRNVCISSCRGHQTCRFTPDARSAALAVDRFCGSQKAARRWARRRPVWLVERDLRTLCGIIV